MRGILPLILVVAVVAMVIFSLQSTVISTMPDANESVDQHGNEALGYFDVSASIPITWRNESCVKPSCEIGSGAFEPLIEQHLGLPPNDRTVSGQSITTGGCKVSVYLEIQDPFGYTMALQESLKMDASVGKNLNVAWGHVHGSVYGWHNLFFTLWVYGGSGCPFYDNLLKPVKLVHTTTAAGFSFVGE